MLVCFINIDFSGTGEDVCLTDVLANFPTVPGILHRCGLNGPLTRAKLGQTLLQWPLVGLDKEGPQRKQ